MCLSRKVCQISQNIDWTTSDLKVVYYGGYFTGEDTATLIKMSSNIGIVSFKNVCPPTTATGNINAKLHIEGQSLIL